MKKNISILKKIKKLTQFRHSSADSLISYLSKKSNPLSKSINFSINSSYFLYKNFVKQKESRIFSTSGTQTCSTDSSYQFRSRNSENSVNNIFEQFFPDLRKLNCSLTRTEKKYKFLNLVTDSIAKDSLFGGVATALILATLYCNKYDLPLRIITRRAIANPTDYYHLLEFYQLQKPQRVEFSTDTTPVLISAEDEFLATSWWSAYSIRKTFPTRKFFYLIQEVETFFYPHGDQHLFCKTIENDENIIFIVNSHFLNEYFINHGRLKGKSCCFEPAFPKVFRTDKISQKSIGDKNRLFFYARPQNPRNLFWTGLQLIDKAIQTGLIDTSDWDIYLAGSENYPGFVFSNGYEPIKVGVMDLNSYRDFLNKTDLTISLMYTPHPSYPPYDSLLSGCVVLTNSFENKSNFKESNNIIVTKLEPEDFLKNLDKAIRLACDIEKRSSNYINSNFSTDWNENLEQVMRFMNDNIK